MLAAFGIALDAQPVELGDLRIHSRAGQQLRASVPLAGTDAAESEGQCFNAVLLGADGQPAGVLKTVLQRSSRGPVLLLAGGQAFNEAARVVVESTCGAGARREYAVTFEAAPGASAMVSPPSAIPGKDAQGAVAVPRPSADGASSVPDHAGGDRARDAAPVHKLQAALAREEALSRKLKSLETKMGAMLSAPDAEQLLRGAGLPAAPDSGDSSRLVLKLDRSLAFTGPGRAAAEAENRTTPVPGALSFAFMAGAAIWLFLRFRAMGAAPKPLAADEPAP